jgi:hypothetical protein
MKYNVSDPCTAYIKLLVDKYTVLHLKYKLKYTHTV